VRARAPANLFICDDTVASNLGLEKVSLCAGRGAALKKTQAALIRDE
jgi:hypothetical protein